MLPFREIAVRAACALGMCFLVALAACGRKEEAAKAIALTRSAIAKDKAMIPWGGKKAAAFDMPAQTAAEATTGEAYEHRTDNPFHSALREPLSTFSIDVDTASYSNVRRFLTEGRLPPPDAVRIEEMLNYFTYQNPQPRDEHPIALGAEAAMCPWNPKHQLVRISVQGKTLDDESTPPRNLVFLLDTSGSMNAPNRLPLLKHSLRLLAKQLNGKDRVAIVAYAGSAGLVLPPTPGDQYAAIVGALEHLHAGGSTNGGDGIALAYNIAHQTFIPGGANRVILGTDGDFNVGVTGADLVRLIGQKRATGIYLTILGFGTGNLKDATMERLAQHGNGQYAYIDTMAEAQKHFVDNVGGLVTIAKDVKIQVEFNPAWAQAYRLVGYENRLLQNQDFNDDAKDAGDLGAGHAVTALYEIVPPGVPFDLPKIDDLKYQKQSQLAPSADSPDLLTVKLRYIPPQEKQSRLMAVTVKNSKRPPDEASADFRFASAVAMFGMLLRDSPYKGTANYPAVLQLAQGAARVDVGGHRAEFVRLVDVAARLAGK